MPDLDRLPPIPDAEQTPEQKAVSDELVSGPRGRLVGPFAPLLRSPELMRRVQKVGEFLRFESSLPENVKELAILVVARLWGQRFEWSFHLPLALRAGVSREACEAIAQGRAPPSLTAAEQAAYDVLTELNADKAVGDETWRRAALAFGEQGVIELIGVNGYYALLAMVMNATRTPAPDAEIPLS
jgi:4-carboxymuconolactone decarboxylase